MLTSIKSCLKQLLIEPSCAICKRQTSSEADQSGLCQTCQQRLGLAESGQRGMSPLPWRAASWYRGAMRQLILSLRRESEDWLSASDLHESSVRSATRQSADTDPWLEGEEPVESASGTDLPLPRTTNTSAAAALPPHGGSAPAEPSTESEQPVRQLQAEPGIHSVDKPCLNKPEQSAAGLACR